MGPTGTMRAVFYNGARTFTPGKTAIPAAGPGEALLRVLRVGICGTDLHIFQGHLDNRVPHGGIIGHETFAEVVEAPAGSGFTAGDRVVVEPVRFCGTCRACRIGANYICYNLKVLGVDLPGGMQEYWPVPVDRLIKVPDSLPDDHAAVIEPLAVATHDVTRAGVKTGDAVLVFGGGPIGCSDRARLPAPRRAGGGRRDQSLPGRDAPAPRARGRRAPESTPFGSRPSGPTATASTSRSRSPAIPPPSRRSPRSSASGGRSASSRSTRSRCRSTSTSSSRASCCLHGSRLYTRAAWEEAIRLGASGAVPLAPAGQPRHSLESFRRAWRRRSAAARS